MVWGTKGSGKTSLIKDIFWPLFGVSNLEPYSVTSTEFTLLKLFSSTTSVPVFFDEYRNDDITRDRKARFDRYLRRLYGGEIEERGRPDQTVNHYHLTAPVCVGGEGRPEDPAIVDRLVSVTPNPNSIESNSNYQDTFRRLNAMQLDKLAAPYIRFALGRDTCSDLKSASDCSEQILAQLPNKDQMSIRCKDNLKVVIFGLNMFQAFARQFGVELPPFDLRDAVSSSIEDLMETDRGAKNQLDEFIETSAVLAHAGILSENKHYVVVNEQVCIHLRSSWEIYLMQRRQAGKPDVAGGLRAVRRQARENLQRDGYVKENDKIALFGARRVRTLAVDLHQANQTLDVDIFPTENNRTWGGGRANQDNDTSLEYTDY